MDEEAEGVGDAAYTTCQKAKIMDLEQDVRRALPGEMSVCSLVFVHLLNYMIMNESSS